MIMGLTGPNASGKGEVVKFLECKGFYSYSLSDVIREAVRRRGLEITRERLIEVGRELRCEEGNGVLAQRILSQIEEDKNYVVDSFRHPEEMQVFRTRPDFYLV